jgi:hypothetical protein
MVRVYSRLPAVLLQVSKRSSCPGIGIIAAALTASKALGPRKEKASENLTRWPLVSCLQRPACTFNQSSWQRRAGSRYIASIMVQGGRLLYCVHWRSRDYWRLCTWRNITLHSVAELIAFSTRISASILTSDSSQSTARAGRKALGQLMVCYACFGQLMVSKVACDLGERHSEQRSCVGQLMGYSHAAQWAARLARTANDG